MRFPFTATPTSISIFFNGKMASIPATYPSFSKLYEHLKLSEHDFDYVESLLDVPAMITRATYGKVTVVGSTVYAAGVAMRSTIADRLISLMDEGFDISTWLKFINNLIENPSERSRNCLFDFLDKHRAPFTEDGHFLAFKRVRADYKDIHSGTMDNSVGMVVEVPREAVDDNPDRTCSQGLHAAASVYLDSYASAQGNKTIVLKINPRDVVAVPRDYGFSKMRVCRYEVLGDVDPSEIRLVEAENVSTKYGLVADEPEDISAFAAAFCNGYDMSLYEDEFDEYEYEYEDEDECDEDEYEYEDEDECDEDEDAYEESDGWYLPGADDTASEIAFTRAGVTYSAKALQDGVARHGQRGYARMTGLPRSTIQDWLARI
jgi:hypothetical protein